MNHPTAETCQSRQASAPTFAPRIDICETPTEYLLFGDLPGVKPEDLEIRFENGEVTIHGKVEPRLPSVQFLYGEYGVGDFHRTFAISEAIDADKIEAELKQGVLTLHLPKAAALQPRRIAVKSN